jgi:hypothetical protein
MDKTLNLILIIIVVLALLSSSSCFLYGIALMIQYLTFKHDADNIAPGSGKFINARSSSIIGTFVACIIIGLIGIVIFSILLRNLIKLYK